MTEKKAFVFDTNFIIENSDLTEVVSNLAATYNVYVTQVSIEERIFQKYRESKCRYDKISNIQKDYAGIASIRITTSFEEKTKKERDFVEKGYLTLFEDNIIPFATKEEDFLRILDRANKKLPPFSANKDASDKGFKDSLIWVSLLDYFKEKGEHDIVFVTNDTRFREDATLLTQEFREHTGKEICIESNAFYKTIIDGVKKEYETVVEPIPPNINQLREMVRDAALSFCSFEERDDWGNVYSEPSFRTKLEIDATNVESFMQNLRSLILDNIFDIKIRANLIFGDEIISENGDVPMVALEELGEVYTLIRNKLPSFLPQFFSSVAEIINKNCFVQAKYIIEDDDIPF